MKKNYFFTLLLTFCCSILSLGQDLIITGIIDGPLPGGYPKGLELYAKNAIADLSIYGLESTTNGAVAGGVEYTFPSDAIAAETFIYVATTGSSTSFLQYLGVTPQYEDGVVNINGDDTVILYKNSVIEDSIGVIGEDGSGKDWDHLDGWAYRKDGKGPNATFDSSEWTFSGANALDGCDKSDDSGTNAECGSVFPIGTYTTVASTSPELSVTSPVNNNVYNASVTEVAVVLNVSNFTLSNDNGSGVSDGSGDGYIKATLTTDDVTDDPVAFFTETPEAIAVTPGSAYVATAELVDNNGVSLDPKIEVSVSFSVALPCDIQLSTILTTCDASTSGNDTYTTTIDFTGGNTGTTYTITAKDDSNNDVGTIGGSNPDTEGSGQIIITGVSEGTNFTVKVVGGSGSSCDLTRNISSPTCVSFPIEDSFDYADAANLGDQTSWTRLNSGDDMVMASGSLEYAGLKPSTGNKLTFSEVGSETYTSFSDVSTGTIYASFLMKLTGFQTNGSPDLSDGGYIAALAAGTSSYDARFWVRPNPDTSGSTYDIGFGYESSNPTFTSETYNLNDVVFVVMSYNLDTSELNTWINPDVASFEGTIPAATISSTDTNPPSAINLFIFRQDSDRETPFVEVDELRISTSWAEVTPKDATASITNNSIEGFTTYPNPVTDVSFTITTSSADVKQVAMYNVLGKKVYSSEFIGTKATIDITAISSGIYILKVVEGSKIATSKLIIK